MRPWADRTCDLSQSTSEEQQSALMVHRARARTMANRTAQVNQIRGLLGEFGFVVFALPGRTAGQTAPPLRGDAQKNDVESRSGNETRESHREPQDSPDQLRTAPQPQNHAVPDHRSHRAAGAVQFAICASQ